MSSLTSALAALRRIRLSLAASLLILQRTRPRISSRFRSADSPVGAAGSNDAGRYGVKPMVGSGVCRNLE